MVTTASFYVSDIRNYPAGERVIVEQNARDRYDNGYMKPGVLVRVRIERDGTILHFEQGQLDHAVSKRRSA